MHLPVPADRLRFRSSSTSGLTTAEVTQQRARFGTNVIFSARRRSLGQRVRETAADPMLWFLLVTSVVYLSLGDYVEGTILLVSIAPLTAMDAFLHRRTRASTEGLQSRLAAQAIVMRDGREERLPADEVVVGDLVLIRAGEPIPADGLLVTAEELQHEESSLTGEAYPVRKRALSMVPPGEAPLIDAVHWGFAGTRVLTGRGALRVVNAGRQTLYGQIVQTATGNQSRTPLQSAIGQLVLALSVAAAALCVILAVVRVQQGHGWVDALVSATTLAVAALPEEFPIAFTFFLGAGVYRLARRQALVRRAVSVENIGRITSICADKTGTLTEGKLSVTQLVPEGSSSVEQLLTIAARASRVEGADPLDVAIFAEASRVGLTLDDGTRVALFPFTEERRRETAVWQEGDTLFASTKGTPELILQLCELDAGRKTEWLEQVERLAAEGRKAIGCAAQTFHRDGWRGEEPTEKFSFAGLVVCEDPVRDGVADSMRVCREAGVHVMMVTGDHPATATAVGRAIGLGAGHPPRVVLGKDVASLRARGRSFRDVDVVARALPGHKLDLVQALQADGECVVVTGDGVNDVPALQAADVGVAMGERGTQSAREVASIVLLDDNFRTIVRAISEGRQLFHNLRASFKYLLLIHFPLVTTAAFVPLAGYPLLYLPIHIVWLELLIHPTALLSFQAPAPSDHLAFVPRTRRARFFSPRDWLVLVLCGALTTSTVVAGFLHSLAEKGGVEHGRSMAMTMLTLASALFAASLSGLRTRAAIVLAGLTVMVTVVFVQIRPLSVLIHLEPLHLDDWLLALGGAVLPCCPLLVDRATASRRGRA